MINSSCDQPIGYPIYVSPLTTSFSGTNEQYCGIVGKEVSLNSVIAAAKNLWHRLRMRCGAHCTSGGSHMEDPYGCPPTTPQNTLRLTTGAIYTSSYAASLHGSTMGSNETAVPPAARSSLSGGLQGSTTTTNEIPGSTPYMTRRSVVSTSSTASKPSSAFVSLAGLIADTSSSKESVPAQQRIQGAFHSVSF